MKELKVNKLISWDRETVRLLSSYPAILVDVQWVPGNGNGYLKAFHPSTRRLDIRWDATGAVSGVINANRFQQIVVSGTILELVPDEVEPRLEEWVVAISPVEVQNLRYKKPRKRLRRSRKRRRP